MPAPRRVGAADNSEAGTDLMPSDQGRRRPPKDRPPGAEEMFRLIVEGVKDYAIFATDEAGALRGFVKVARDYTGRRLDEERLRVSEARARALIDQSPFSIQILSPGGRTLRVNRAWERLWGVTLEQVAEYNMLEDRQLADKGVMPHVRRGFAGEATSVPPILYDPNESCPGGSHVAESDDCHYAILSAWSGRLKRIKTPDENLLHVSRAPAHNVGCSRARM